MNNSDHDPSHALAIGLDLGGTQVRAALVTRDGRVLDRAALPTKGEGGPEAIFEQFAMLIDKVRSSIPVRDLAGIGIAAPGPLDSIEGVVLGIPTLPGWEGLPLQRMIGDRYGIPAYLENDAKAATLGEWCFGAARGLRNVVYITVSTGIGGGVIADGRLLQGRRGMSAHV